MAKRKRGKTLELYLEDGNTQGAIHASIAGTSLKVRSFSVEDLKRQPKDDIHRGFYLLISSIKKQASPEQSHHFEVYVGESKELARRVQQHSRDDSKAFERIILAYTSDDGLMGDHALFIEAELVEFLTKHPMVLCTNKNAGRPGRLRRRDEDFCHEKMDEFALITASLGYWFMQDWTLEPEEIRQKYALPTRSLSTIALPAEETAKFLPASTVEEASPFEHWPVFYYEEGKHCKAMMRVKGPKEFIMLAGSKVKKDTPLDERKAEMLLELSPEEVGDDWLTTTRDIVFDSASSCIWFGCCKPRATWRSWKSSDGKTLREINIEAGSPLYDREADKAIRLKSEMSQKVQPSSSFQGNEESIRPEAPFEDWPVFEFHWAKRKGCKGYCARIKILGKKKVLLLQGSYLSNQLDSTVMQHYLPRKLECLAEALYEESKETFKLSQPLIVEGSFSFVSYICNPAPVKVWANWKTPDGLSLDEYNHLRGNPMNRSTSKT